MLMLFNFKSSYTSKEISELLEINIDDVKKTLVSMSLMKEKLLSKSPDVIFLLGILIDYKD